MFKVTTSVRKMLSIKPKNKAIQGATSSGKTYGIIPILYDRALATPNTLITIVAETVPSLKDGVVKIFQDFMFEEGRWRDECWLGNPMQYTLPNRSKIQFKSFDSEGKAKASGKREILFINECNHVDYKIADALMIRTTGEVWLDFNADAEFWVHTEVLTEPDSELLKLTYLDNEAIPQGTLEKMLQRKYKAEEEDKNGKRGYWWNWWQVYGLGEIGNLQGAIFNNYEIKDIPKDARLLYYGCDFGFAKSKNAVIAVYKYNNEIYLKQLVYANEMFNVQFADMIKEAGYKWGVMYCDYAEPKSISELQANGIAAVKCEPKNDIKDFAIRTLNKNTFYVDSNSLDLINELRYYIYDEKTNKPKKSNTDHLMDALLYAIGSGDKYSGQYK